MKSFVRFRILIALAFLWTISAFGQNVFIVVVDGPRYSESFGSKDRYLPRIWNELRPQGTIYTNFHNDGITATIPGHDALISGVYQKIANDGSQSLTSPTIFEYFRQQTGAPDSACFVVSGKKKLHVLTHSIDSAYGERYGARFVSTDTYRDSDTWDSLVNVMDMYHPRLVVVNLPQIDARGHAGEWDNYLAAIRQADSLVALLWQKLQSDSLYSNRTTLFVTNDHGRHDDQHGGFQHHGDSCNGCRHIMLLALGPDFPAGMEVTDPRSQIDVFQTAAGILGLHVPPDRGHSLVPHQTRD
jgi:hypothetical protein